MDRKIYLTFDMDWANDNVLEWFYQFLENNIPYTLFVTHETKWIEQLRKDNHIELGIHPNFNRLLSGDNSDGNYLEVLKRLKDIVPEAKAYRSHSLTVNSVILQACAELGIKKDLNILVRPKVGDVIHPFVRSGVQIVPFIWEDDLWLCDSEKLSVDFLLGDSFDIPRVFNFHPIHLYLNCESIDRYNAAKGYNREIDKLSQFRNQGENVLGVREFFDELVETALKKGYEFDVISNCLEG